MKNLIASIFLVIIYVFLVSWGYEGHQTIARIAENYLTPSAKSAVKQLLGHQALTDISSWADEVRSQPEWKFTAPWHFVNVPPNLDALQFKLAVEHDTNPNLYSALQKCEGEIMDPDVSAEQKANDLKFIVHLVGDAHQPMHVSRAEDKGGNTIQVQFDGRGTNLHSVWDTKLIDHQGLTYSQIADQFGKATSAEIIKWQNSDPIDWMFESYQISARLYAEIEKNNKLDEAYYTEHIGILDERIKLAGIRLAGVLNNLFKNGVVIKDGPGQSKKLVDTLQKKVISIDVREASSHYNENVNVTSKVYGSKDFGNMVLLNLGADYPDQLLTVVLRGDVKKIANELEGKVITVTGKVVEYKGRPEIVVTEATQIRLFQ